MPQDTPSLIYEGNYEIIKGPRGLPPILSGVWSGEIRIKAVQVQALARMEFIHKGSGRPASPWAAVVIVDVNRKETYKEIGGLESEPTIKGD